MNPCGIEIILSCLLSFPLNGSLAQNQSPSLGAPLHTTPNEVIIRLRPDISQAEFRAFNRQLSAETVEPVFPRSTPAGRDATLNRIYLVRFPTGWPIEPLIKRYRGSRFIEAVEPNYLNRPLGGTKILPNDPRFSEQWNLMNINMPGAYAIERGNPSVIIAVVDSGIDLNHEDLRSQLWRNPREIPGNGVDDDNNGYVDDIVGWDFSDAPTLPGRGDYTERDNDPGDETGHGTHVSGIIAASANNGIGVAGIAWGCKMMPLRAGFVVASGGAFLQDDDVSAAIVYAADNGAKVINMSWGDVVDSFVIHDAVEYAYHRGCVLVGAAGNSHVAGALYPAALKTVLAVAATERDNTLAFVSNFGASIDIAAPGGAVLSTQLGNTYGALSGTSMAAPHVSGVAALLLSQRPELSNEEVRQMLVATASPIVDNRLVGAGLLNAEAALQSIGDLTAKLFTSRRQRGGGADREIEIVGTAGGNGFLAYRLEFGSTEVPSRWFPIGELQQRPKFNDVLGRWDTSLLEEGVYTIRLTVRAQAALSPDPIGDETSLRDKAVVWIDHTPPEISEHQAGLWLSRDGFNTVVTWRTDDLTDGEIEFRLVGSNADFDTPLATQSKDFTRIHTAATSRQHTLNLSPFPSPEGEGRSPPFPPGKGAGGLGGIGRGVAPSGEYEYRLSVRNRAGAITVDDNGGKLHRVRITDQRISPNRLHTVEGRLPLPALHVASALADFNRNGQSELVAMEIGGTGYKPTQIFERDTAGNYRSIFSTEKAFFPWAIGDTDGDGLIEILGNRNEQTFLIEQSAPGEFPEVMTWEVDGIWGGQIADLDGDGRPELISRHSATNAIWIHSTFGNNRYRRIAELANPDLRSGDNGIGTTFAIGDFDGDGQTELAAGDADGDVFIYEAVGDNQYRQTWVGKIDARAAHNLAAGDLDGDGVPEFVVGGQSVSDAFDLPVQHWIYVIFKSIGNDTYKAVWTQRLQGVSAGGNGIAIADTDNDEHNELAIVAWPNFYLIQREGEAPAEPTLPAEQYNYTPIWYHSASSTFRPIVADIDGDGRNELMFNDADSFTIFASSVALTAALTPWGLAANPINETSIRLSWQAPPNAVEYTIYQGIGEGTGLTLFREGIRETTFTDEGLKEGQTYWYAVAGRDSSGNLSGQSQPVSVTPTSPPRLTAAEYFNPERLLLHFDKPMGPSAAEPSHYRLTEIGLSAFHLPRSALLDRSGRRVVATYEAGTMRPLQTYQIRAVDLRDTAGTPIASDANAFILTVPQATQITDLSSAIVYPNPVRTARVIFDRLPPDTEIRIHDVAGNLIASFALNPGDRGKKVWNLRQSDHPVSSGIYVYVLEARGKKRMGKLAVIQ